VQHADAWDDVRARNSRATLEHFLAGCGIAINIAQNPYFKDFCKSLNAAYTAPDSTTARKFDIPHLFQHVKSKVASYWSSVSSRMALAFDGVRGEDGHHLVIVTQCVARNEAFRSCVDPGERRENAVFYRDVPLAELEAGAEEFGQAVYERHCGIVGESVSYNQVALRYAESVHPKLVTGGCFAHTLDPMIEAVCKAAEIRAIVHRTRDIVTFVKSHEYVQAMFDKTRSPSIKAVTLNPGTLFCFVALMLHRVMANRATFDAMLGERS
jgi:hypothetical protein